MLTLVLKGTEACQGDLDGPGKVPAVRKDKPQSTRDSLLVKQFVQQNPFGSYGVLQPQALPPERELFQHLPQSHDRTISYWL